MGVLDGNESLDGANTEETKLTKILEKIGVDKNIRSHRRLGNSVGDRKRPILVTVASKEVRDNISEKARATKGGWRSLQQNMYQERSSS